MQMPTNTYCISSTIVLIIDKGSVIKMN